jgi:hypothetical protein
MVHTQPSSVELMGGSFRRSPAPFRSHLARSEPVIKTTITMRVAVVYRRRVDSDNTGVVATVVGSPNTTESDGKATISVKLSSQATVAEGKRSAASLTFTSTTQTVTVTGRNDFDEDGDVDSRLDRLTLAQPAGIPTSTNRVRASSAGRHRGKR